MGAVVPGFREAIREAARRLRRDGWPGTRVPTPKELLDAADVEPFFRVCGGRLLASGWDPDDALTELDTLSVHAFYALSYELHLRKTFWVDESLAFMLLHTRLDVRGEGLPAVRELCCRLHRPCGALARGVGRVA